MDIVAKHTMPDQNGVRIASLDEMCIRDREDAYERKINPMENFSLYESKKN